MKKRIPNQPHPKQIKIRLKKPYNRVALRGESPMTETISAIVSGLLLVLASMLIGGVVYVVVRDVVKRSVDRQD
jgi:hypothetical protein